MSTETKFSKSHIDLDLTDLPSGTYDNELFYNCTFKKVRDVTLRNCTMAQSTFLTEQIEDALGFTVTLDCMAFDDVELSPLMFDLLMVLLIKTKGNTEKRRRLIDVIGRERLHELLKAMKQLGR